MFELTGAKAPQPKKKQVSAACIALLIGWVVEPPIRLACRPAPLPAAARVTALRIAFQLALAWGEPVSPSIEPLPSMANCSELAALGLPQSSCWAGVGAGLPLTQSGRRCEGWQAVNDTSNAAAGAVRRETRRISCKFANRNLHLTFQPYSY